MQFLPLIKCMISQRTQRKQDALYRLQTCSSNTKNEVSHVFTKDRNNAKHI